MSEPGQSKDGQWECDVCHLRFKTFMDQMNHINRRHPDAKGPPLDPPPSSSS